MSTMIQNPNEIEAFTRRQRALARIHRNIAEKFQLNRRQFISGSLATMALAALGLSGCAPKTPAASTGDASPAFTPGTYEATEVIDCQGRYLAPGFIDGHLHIESSNIRPAEYARMAATRGTTTAIADSHEIANVSGLDGLRFMIEDGRRAPISIKYMMPSCVPALPDLSLIHI